MLIRQIGLPPKTSDEKVLRIPSSSAVQVLAPAKINLHLEVLGRRADGYHALETLMVAIELFDEITISACPNDIELTCDAPGLTVGPDNLVLKAARLLQARSGCSDGAWIELVKRIPWAAGLGGGSSDAAATLAGLNEWWQLGLAREDLVALGAELGSDVPFFFHTPAAFCTGRGEVVTPVPVGCRLDLLLVKPPMGLSTAEVYRECGVGLNLPSEYRSPAEALAALASGDVEKLGHCLHNRLQARPCVFARRSRKRIAGCKS